MSHRICVVHLVGVAHLCVVNTHAFKIYDDLNTFFCVLHMHTEFCSHSALSGWIFRRLSGAEDGM